MPGVSSKGLILLISTTLAYLATDVDGAYGGLEPSATSAPLEAAAKATHMPGGFMRLSNRQGGSARKAVAAVSALVASMLLAKLFHRAIKGKKVSYCSRP